MITSKVFIIFSSVQKNPRLKLTFTRAQELNKNRSLLAPRCGWFWFYCGTIGGGKTLIPLSLLSAKQFWQLLKDVAASEGKEVAPSSQVTTKVANDIAF